MFSGNLRLRHDSLHLYQAMSSPKNAQPPHHGSQLDQYNRKYRIPGYNQVQITILFKKTRNIIGEMITSKY